MNSNFRKNKPDISWVWFDLDDTLFDFSTSSQVALTQLFSRYSLDRFFENNEIWIDKYHAVNAALWQLFNAGKITQKELRFQRFMLPLSAAGVAEEEMFKLVKRMDVEYLELLSSSGLSIEGASETIECLKLKGYKIGILSNGFSEVQYDKLKNIGLSPFIDCVVLSDEIDINKPDKRLFDYALQKSACPVGASLMVGDNLLTDIEGAKNAGWDFVLFDPHNSYDISPKVVSLKELQEYL